MAVVKEKNRTGTGLRSRSLGQPGSRRALSVDTISSRFLYRPGVGVQRRQSTLLPYRGEPDLQA
jgi:hypothetical protein